MLRFPMVLGGLAAVAGLGAGAPAEAQTVMQQCGQQYQAAKAAGTLNGATWNQYRTECAAKMKATPAAAPAAPAPAPAPAEPASVPDNPLKPAITPATTAAEPAAAGKAAAPASAGRTAMLARERQCGAEWRSQKVTLVAKTPGLTWPKFWSACNTRLKAAGQ